MHESAKNNTARQWRICQQENSDCQGTVTLWMLNEIKLMIVCYAVKSEAR